MDSGAEESQPGPQRFATGWLLLVLGLVALAVSAGTAWLVLADRKPDAPSGATTPAADVKIPTDPILRKGQRLYQIYCTACHGPQGHGDGPSATDLKPPLRDFGAGPWKFGSTPAAVRLVIANGIPGTRMPGLGSALPAEDLDALVAYVLTLGPKA
jgi:mono/diheme cytochrome c family protein